jgi:purine-nucleoside phosphorylase
LLPDPLLLEALADTDRQFEGISRVRVGTIDALYRETYEYINELRSQGIQAINMETASFYAACSSCGVSGLWIGHISDCLVGDLWEDWSVDRRDMSIKTANICMRILEMIADGTMNEAVE